MSDCKCGHEKFAHDLDKFVSLYGKCLMKEDGCRCKKYQEESP